MKRILTLVAMLVLSLAAFALPTLDAVQAEVGKGNYAQAETMMREVVAAKPGSARAHYVYAEVLAHNGHFDTAADEARLARQLDPALTFTQADKFRAFEQLLEQEQRAAQARKNGPALTAEHPAPAAVRTAPVAERSGGMPGWLWGAGFAVIAVLLWRLVTASRRQSAAAATGPWPAAATAGPMAGPATGGFGGGAGAGFGGAPGFGGGAGSGMLGTGIAAAGGFAAGMLAEKLFDGHRDAAAAGNPAAASSGAGAGGLVPGMFDDAPAHASADELERRPIDFGSGNDWDSGSSSSSDSSNDSSDDGW